MRLIIILVYNYESVVQGTTKTGKFWNTLYADNFIIPSDHPAKLIHLTHTTSRVTNTMLPLIIQSKLHNTQ